MYAEGYDRYDNYLGASSVTWGSTGSLDAVSSSGVSYVFSPSTATTSGTITATAGAGVFGDATGTITVNPGNPVTVTGSPSDTVSGLAGQELVNPLQVLVLDASGNPVPGVTVDWSTNSDGLLTPLQSVTNVSGITTTSWRLKSTLGLDSAYAVVSAIPSTVKFLATVLPATANRILRYATSDSARTGVAGQTISGLTVQVVDEFGNPVSGVSITFAVNGIPPSTVYSFSPASGLTNGSGLITTDFTIGDKVGIYAITALNNTLLNSGKTFFSVTASPDSPAELQIVSGNQQSGIAGQSLTNPVRIRVVDQYENAISGTTVNWTATSAGSVDPPSSVSNALGIAEASWTLRQAAGSDTLIASSAGLADINFTAQALPAPAFAVFADSGQNRSSIAGGNMILRARVEDQYGNGIQNVSVTFQPLAAGGYVSQSVVQTDASGLASTIYTNPGNQNSTVVNATVSGVGTVSFTTYHVRYVDNSLRPKVVPVDTVIAFYIDVTNPGSDVIPLDVNQTIFSFANDQFSADVDSPLTLNPGLNSIKFNQNSITSGIGAGSFTPKISFRGSGIYEGLNGTLQTSQGELVIEPVYIKSIQTIATKRYKVGDIANVEMIVVNRGSYPVSIGNAYLTFNPDYPELVQTRTDTGTVINAGEEKRLRFSVEIQPRAAYVFPETINMDGFFRCTCTQTGAMLTDNSADATDYFEIVEAAEFNLISFTPTHVSENQTVNFTVRIENLGQYDFLLDRNNTLFVFGSQSFQPVSNQAIAGLDISDISFSPVALTLSSGSYSGILYIQGTENGSPTLDTLYTYEMPTADSLLIVQTPGNLNLISTTLSADTVSQGDEGLNITLEFQNTGQGPVVIQHPDSIKLRYNDSGVNYNILTPVQIYPYTIPGNTTQSLQWTIQVRNDAQIGPDSIFVDEVVYRELNSGLDISDPYSNQYDYWEIVGNGSLQIYSVGSEFNQVSTGQTGIPVTVRVRNNGTNPVRINTVQLSITPNQYIAATLVNNNLKTLLPAQADTFMFNVSVNESALSGPASLNAQISGLDLYTGLTLTDNSADTTDSWFVQQNAVVSIVSVSPDTVSAGQGFSPVLSIRNEGEARVEIDTSQSFIRFTSGTDVFEHRFAAQPSYLNGESTIALSFNEKSVPSGFSGDFNLELFLYGIENQAVFDTTIQYGEPLVVQLPGNLLIESVVADGVNISRGVDTTVFVYVRNTGQAGVNVDTITVSPYGQPVHIIPDLPYRINSGPSTSFETTVHVPADASTGLITLQARATGTDINSGQRTSATNTDTWNVYEDAVISISRIISDEQFVDQGETFNLNITIRNDGGSPVTVDNVILHPQIGLYNYFPPAFGFTVSANDSVTIPYTLTVMNNSAVGVEQITGEIQFTNQFSYKSSISNVSDVLDITIGSNIPKISIVRVNAIPTMVSQGQLDARIEVRLLASGDDSVRVDSLRLNFNNNSNYSYQQSDIYVRNQGIYLPVGMEQDEELVFVIPVDIGALYAGPDTMHVTVYFTELREYESMVEFDPGVDDSWIVLQRPNVHINNVSINPVTASTGQTGLVGSVFVSNESGVYRADAFIDSVQLQMLYSGTDYSNQFTITRQSAPSLPLALPAGNSSRFDFNLDVNTDAITGVYTGSAVVENYDANDGQRQIVNTPEASGNLTVQSTADLSINQIWVEPDTVSKGQENPLVYALIQNTGQAGAVVNTIMIDIIANLVNLDFNQALINRVTPYPLAGGQTDTLIFDFEVPVIADTGGVDVYVSIAGNDVNTGNNLFNERTEPRAFYIQSPADIHYVNNSLEPYVIQNDSTFSFTMDIQNSGEASVLLNADSTNMILGGSTYKIYLDPASNTFIPGDNNPVHLTFQETPITGLPDGEYPVTLNIFGLSNDDIYTQSLSAGKFFVGDTLTSIISIDMIGTTTHLQGDTGITVRMTLINSGTAMPIDNNINMTTLLFEHLSSSINTRPYINSLRRTDNLDTLITSGVPQIVEFKFDLAADYPTGASKITGRVSLDGGILVLTTKNDSVLFNVQSAGNAVYVENSLQPDSVVNNQIVSFTMAFADTGSSDFTLNQDSTYIQIAGQPRIYLAGRYILQGMANTNVTFNTFTVNGLSEGLHDIHWNAEGTLSNGLYSEFSGDIINGLRVILPALPAFTDVTIEPDTVRNGQIDIPMHVTIRNNGQSPAVIKNIQYQFNQGGQDVTEQWLLQNAPVYADTINPGAQRIYNPEFTLAVAAVPGMVNSQPRIIYSDVRTPHITSNQSVQGDSVVVVKPATIRVDSLIAVSFNTPQVNLGQPFGLRLKLINNGDDKISRAYLSVFRNNQPDPGGMHIQITDMGSEVDTMLQRTISAPSTPGNYTYRVQVDSVFDRSDQPVIIEQSVDNQELIVIQNPVHLSLAASITEPAGATDGILSRNQTITISANVTNNGQAKYNSVQLALRLPAGNGFIITENPADSIRNVVDTTGTVSWNVIPQNLISTALLTVVVKNVPIDLNTGQPALMSKSQEIISVQVLEEGSIVTPTLAVISPAGALDRIISTGQSFTLRSIFKYNEAVANTGRQARIVTNNPLYAIAGEATRNLAPEDTSADWNLVAPEAVSSTDQIRIVFYGIDKNSGLPIDSAETNIIQLTVEERAKLRLSLKISEPAGARDDTISAGQAFKLEALVLHEGSWLASNSGQLTLSLPDGFTMLDTAGIPANATKSFVISTPTVPVMWWLRANQDEASVEMMEAYLNKALQIDENATEIPLVIAVPKISRKRNTSQIDVYNSSAFGLNIEGPDAVQKMGDNFIKIMALDLPNDGNTGIPASMANRTDSIFVHVENPAEIGIASVEYPDTVSTGQIFEMAVHANLIKNVLNPQIHFTFLGQEYDPISMSAAGSVRIQIQVPNDAVSSPGNINIRLTGMDMNSGYTISSETVDTTIVIEKNAVLALSKPSVFFTTEGEPDDRTWNGELSEGQEFRIFVTPKYQNYDGNLNYAGVKESGAITMIIDPAVFFLVNTSEPLQKSFTNLNEPLSWALRARRLTNVEVKSSAISFKFGTLPKDENTNLTVALSPDSSTVSEPAVVRKKKIKVELLASGSDTLLSFKVFNDEFNEPLYISGFDLTFLNGPEGDDVFAEQTFRNTFNILNVEKVNQGAATPVQILTIDPDTASVPLSVMFATDHAIGPGTNTVFNLRGTFKEGTPSREFRSKLLDVWAWDQSDSIYLDIVDRDLMSIDQSELLVSNPVTHYSGTVEDDFMAYPNPFGRGQNQEAFIAFRIEQASDVDIRIFTLLGELVKTYQLTGLPQGLHDRRVRWGGTNDRGKRVLNGVYLCFIDIKATGQRFVTKIAYIK
ncbi:MAG: Ig-like domain-containing protein [Calditrichaceae bacterium]|nr:Ig-like domain-containing protein [Calditrichaceae bacterium]